jgi:hydroxyacylglutathione hydrolase/adenylyltransferase/sulfurtransferase
MTDLPPLLPSAFADPTLELEPADVAARHVRGEIQLVDVRERYEWDAGHVPGARHVEIERVASRAPTIDRARPVIFICRLGVRAGMVATAYRAIGYDAYNVRGGFTRWHGLGLPTEPDGAVVADH